MNSLFNILQPKMRQLLTIFNHSSYCDLDNFKLLAERNNERLSIRSISKLANIESINKKFSEIEAFLEELNKIKFKFSLICLQES